MNRPFINAAIFTIAVVFVFGIVSQVVTDISGLGGQVAAAEGVNPEAGEAIYWGKGKCGTCHSIGSKGSAIRGVNHENLFITAAERAAELGLPSPTAYLVQSIADPEAYVVKGYKAEMPKVYQPPISLKPDEIRAVITYLQIQGGEADPGAIKLPEVILQAAAAGAKGEPFKIYQSGESKAGKTLFFDKDSPAGCAKCHTFDGQGGDVGPDLTEEASVRTLPFIIESILFPSAKIASGFEPVLLRTKDGRTINGVLRKEDDASITLVTKEGEVMTIPKADIARRAEDPPSIMPDNFSELLSVKQFHDILAFLQSKLEKQPGP